MKEIPAPDLPAFDRLRAIVEALRSPDGCPWDRSQTAESLRGALIEETYEAVDAINNGNAQHVREELGDVVMIASMIGRIYEETGAFSLNDSLADANEKLIRRHPHVFGDAVAETPEAVAKQWKSIKENIEGRKKNSVLDEVRQSLPPLDRAYKLQKKAAKLGFDWPTIDGVWDKIFEEIAEVRELLELGDDGDGAATGSEEAAVEAAGTISAAHSSRAAAIATAPDRQLGLEEELGDLLFSVVNLARFLEVDPSLALQRSIAKFDSRFRHVEAGMARAGLEMNARTMDSMEALWQEAKQS